MPRPSSFSIRHCSRPGCAICAAERPLSRGERASVAGIAALFVMIFLIGALFANALEREYLAAEVPARGSVVSVFSADREGPEDHTDMRHLGALYPASEAQR